MVPEAAESPRTTEAGDRCRDPGGTIRVGVLVDGVRVPRYINRLLAYLSTRENMNLAAVIVHRCSPPGFRRFFFSKQPGSRSLDGLVARATLPFVIAAEKLVESLRGRASHPLRSESVEFPSESIVRIVPLSTDQVAQYDYSPADLERLSKLSLDYLVVESAEEPAPAARSSMARLGVVRMRFGDGPATPASQAGFKEVCHRDPSTSFRVTVLHGTGETPILEGAFMTRFTMVGNRNELLRKSYPHLAQAIATHFARTASNNPLQSSNTGAAGAAAFCGLLTTRDLFGSFWPRIKHTVTGARDKLLGRKQCWRIAWYRGHWQEVGAAKSRRVVNSTGRFFADPFVVHKSGRHICFAEEYDFEINRGFISALDLTGDTARNLGAIIQEPFHLSFPFVFEFGSRLYLCPETAQAEQIRVYECVDFPMEWKLRKVLMDKVRAADTMLFEHDTRWWMSTNIDPQGSNDFESRMYLFWSHSPLSSEWTPHPLNPVVFDPLCGRNAGFVRENGALYRCAQRQGFGLYGEAFSIRKITRLTPDDYVEKLHAELEPGQFGARGTHHLHHDDALVVRDECQITRPA